eukprot:2655090-Alexandrium_andersonii.AAC.1
MEASATDQRLCNKEMESRCNAFRSEQLKIEKELRGSASRSWSSARWLSPATRGWRTTSSWPCTRYA